MADRTAASEADVLRAIKDLLAAMHIPAFRMNSGVVPLQYKGKKRWVRFGEVGMADLICFPWSSGDRPIILWVETKAPSGQQSAYQKAFQKYVQENGMSYLVAWDAQDVLDWLRSRGIK